MTRAPSRRSEGTRIGPFRLERYLGGGQDTEVWRANGDGIVVAVKLRRAGIDDPLATARLAREAAVLRQAHHPTLIGLFDAGEDDGEPFLAFVFHDGPTVAESIDQGRLPVPVAAAVFAPVAEALAALHRHAIVHRDVKPANVLLTGDGPLLIDAGHASVAATTYDGWVDSAPAIAGTTVYLAPEADTTAPAPPLDVYALGISMLEAITGRADAAATADAPPAVRALLVASTDTDPSCRPTAADLATALWAIAGDTTAPTRVATRGNGRREASPSDAVIDLTALEGSALEGIEPEPSGSGRTGSGRTGSGRSAELVRLIDSAHDGAAVPELRAVLVSAPPGAGKSWLVDAAASRLERAGSKVVRAACSPARGDVRVVGAWLLDLGRTAGGVRELVDVAGAAPGAALLRATGLTRGGEADVDPAVVADAIAAVLGEAARGTESLVCIVEDLHHASLELLDLLSRLALRAGIAGALWCTTRPNWVDADELGFEVMALGALDPDAIAALVLGADAADAASEEPSGAAHAYATRVAEILAVAGGNPLHAREAALALARGETLADHSSLPELIAARFASFEPSLRDALGVAAACGDDFWPEALGPRFLDAVPELYRAGVAQARMSSTLAASTEAHFRHPLLREIAYASLDEARRRQIHGELGLTLEHAGAPAEIVAGQAGTAFRLGDGTAAPLAARAAADAGREALDRFSLQAAADWIALLRETGSETEPGLADLLDTELALDNGEYERARALVGAEPEHGPLAPKRLVLATRAAYGTGELPAAAEYGERALARLTGEPVEAAAHVVTYGMVLSRIGRHDEALNLLDRAVRDAQSAAEPGLAAQLAVEAADVVRERVRLRGGYFTEAIDRARTAVDELRASGNQRRYIASIPALVETLAIDHPREALELAIDAARQATTLGDDTSLGGLVLSICDTALEAEDPLALGAWLPELSRASFDVLKRYDADKVRIIAHAAMGAKEPRTHEQLLGIADRLMEIGDESRADTPRAAALCSLLWRGRVQEARELLQTTVGRRLPPPMLTLYEMALRALEGPQWTLTDLDLQNTTTLHHYERAFLQLLSAERDEADGFFRKRYADRKEKTASARQRFSPYFPGALISALGPPDTEPDVDWLLEWIHRPPVPGLWVAHRAICALLLSERDAPPEPGLAAAAIRIIESTDADPVVREWISERAKRSAP